MPLLQIESDMYVMKKIGTILPVDLSTNNAGTPISIGSRPFFIAITPDGLTAYATCPFDGQVVPIDLVSNTPEAPIEVMSSKKAPSTFPINGLSEKYEDVAAAQSSGPAGIAITPDGSTAYIANIYDNSVIGIDLKTKTPVATIPVGNTPFSIAITPNGRTAYVVNSNSNDVTPIDIATNATWNANTCRQDPHIHCHGTRWTNLLCRQHGIR